LIGILTVEISGVNEVSGIRIVATAFLPAVMELSSSISGRLAVVAPKRRYDAPRRRKTAWPARWKACAT